MLILFSTVHHFRTLYDKVEIRKAIQWKCEGAVQFIVQFVAVMCTVHVHSAQCTCVCTVYTVHSGEKWREGTLGTSRGAIWTPNMPRIAPGVSHLKSFEYLHRQLPKVAETCVLLRTEQLSSDIGRVVVDNVTEFQKYCNNWSLTGHWDQISSASLKMALSSVAVGTKGLEERWEVLGG